MAAHLLVPYAPRRQFMPYHDTQSRFRVIVAHRRAGKTVATINELIRSTITCDKPQPRTAFIAPLHKQAKAIAWDYARHYSQAIPGTEVNESELRIDFPNSGRLRLYGADNPDALRGIYLDDCVCDEFADMRPRFLPEVLRPALSDRKGRLTLIGTPKGRNEFCEAYEGAEKEADWFRMMLKASETGLVDSEELASARRMMSEDQYAQEYECSFTAAIQGSYYGRLLEDAASEGRIAEVPYRKDLPVFTAWDIGLSDDTSIWFCQRVGAWVHVIDHYSSNGEPASHYARIVLDRPYAYDTHYLPHDADAGEWGTGRRRIDTLRAAGLGAGSGSKGRVVVLDRQPINDGINAVRLSIPIMRFDAQKCERGIESLRQYRRDYDEQRRAFKDGPLHDWASHDADAMRYLCMGLRPEAVTPPKPPKYQRTPLNPTSHMAA